MQDDSDSMEQLSAFVDGELGRDESRFLQRRVAADPACRDRLRRYHAIGAAARGEYAPGGDSLADRVGQALADEPAHAAGAMEAPEAAEPRGWRRLSPVLQPVAGMAIAASVALGLVVAWPLVSGPSQPTMDVAVRAPAEPAAGNLTRVGGAANAGSGMAVPADTEVRRRLNPYFVNHSEHAATGRLGGTLKYARIVSHDAER